MDDLNNQLCTLGNIAFGMNNIFLGQILVLCSPSACRPLGIAKLSSVHEDEEDKFVLPREGSAQYACQLL